MKQLYPLILLLLIIQLFPAAPTQALLTLFNRVLVISMQKETSVHLLMQIYRVLI